MGACAVCGHPLNATIFEVNFSSDASASPQAQEPSLAGDLDLRIAGRTFRAAGGDLALTRTLGTKVTGYVHLLLAN